MSKGVGHIRETDLQCHLDADTLLDLCVGLQPNKKVSVVWYSALLYSRSQDMSLYLLQLFRRALCLVLQHMQISIPSYTLSNFLLNSIGAA